jgi:hypothetical protein
MYIKYIVQLKVLPTVTVKRWTDVFVMRFNMMYFELKEFVFIYKTNQGLFN